MAFVVVVLLLMAWIPSTLHTALHTALQQVDDSADAAELLTQVTCRRTAGHGRQQFPMWPGAVWRGISRQHAGMLDRAVGSKR